MSFLIVRALNISNPLTTAKQINEAHKLARSSAESAIKYAIKCGELLTAQKAKLNHGEWKGWVEANCEFSYPRAAAYMKVANDKSRVRDFSSIRQALGYEQKLHLAQGTGDNEWYTPQKQVEAVKEVEQGRRINEI